MSRPINPYLRRVHIYQHEYRAYGPDGVNVIFERNNLGVFVKRFVTLNNQGSIVGVTSAGGYAYAVLHDDYCVKNTAIMRRTGWLDRGKGRSTSTPTFAYSTADPVNLVDPWGLKGSGGNTNGPITTGVEVGPWGTMDPWGDFGVFDSWHEFREASPLTSGVDRWHWGYSHGYTSLRGRWSGPCPLPQDPIVKWGVVPQGAPKTAESEIQRVGQILAQGQLSQLTALERKNVHIFLAIVAGESSDNAAEAKEIAEVMINRMILKSVTFDSPDFLNKIGGKPSFAATSETGKTHGYPVIMGMTLEKTLNQNDLSIRVNGGLTAMIDPQENDPMNLHTPYFWDRSSDEGEAQTGPWNWVKKGTHVVTKRIGATTFCRYIDPRKRWP